MHRTDEKILIVDDEPNGLKVLSAILQEEGYTVLQSLTVDDAVCIVRAEEISAVITDVKMPRKDGFQFFEYIRTHHPGIPVIFLTAYGSVESAVDAITNGAFYYFIKPPDYSKLKQVLGQALEVYRLKKETEDEKERAIAEHNAQVAAVQTSPLSPIIDTIDAVKDSESSILILGETGTGKEIIARNLHFRSKRYRKPFVVVNCAAIPRELIESELFGHEKGAFTGAVVSRAGKFEEAADGTILLDEIGELELSLQAKLLRVLQEREVERLGSNKKTRINFRLISSTNRDLKKEIAAGRFREDLFYRINVVQLNIPPLRDRRDDIPLLTAQFVNEFCVREKKSVVVSDEVMDLFMDYSWPGNVRELKNIIERAVVLSRGRKVLPCDLPEELSGHRPPQKNGDSITSLKMLEYYAINAALQECSGNKSRAAKRLGISRKSLYKKIRESWIYEMESSINNTKIA